MAARLDDLLKEAPAPSPAARLRARALLEAELHKPVKRGTWRREALWGIAAIVGVIAVLAVGGLAAGILPGHLFVRRMPSLTLLLLTAVVGAFAALAPRRLWLKWTGVGLALVSAVAMVTGRWSQGIPNAAPEWVCTASHVGVAIVPIIVAVTLLRRAAPGALRFIVGGLSVGTVGAFLGQLGCGDDGLHVLTYHLGAWALITAAVLVIGRRVKPRSYAP